MIWRFIDIDTDIVIAEKELEGIILAEERLYLEQKFFKSFFYSCNPLLGCVNVKIIRIQFVKEIGKYEAYCKMYKIG